MKRLIIFFLFIFSYQFMYAQENILDIDSDILRMMYALWKDSGFGKDPNRTERTAWIVSDSLKSYTLICWPRSADRNQELWYGPIPQNTIAQIHTHTDKVDPRPARKDVELAKKIGISVYTVSTTGIWIVKPDGILLHPAAPFGTRSRKKKF